MAAPRYLLIRTSALGDVVHGLPVLAALRRHQPEAHIGWVVEASLAPLLTGHPWIDELFPVRLRPWRREPFSARTRREIAALRRALRAFRPDVAIDLMGNHKAGAIARFSGARERLGARQEDRREPSSAFWINRPVATRGVHAVDRTLSLLDGLGLPAEAPDFAPQHLPAADAAEDTAEPFVLLHPGAGWGNKVYPPERWAAALRRIHQESGLRCLVALSPSPTERALAEAIVARTDGAAALLEGGDLPTLTAQLRRARLVLGGDTGPLHLAHALGRPVLMTLGPTDPERHGPCGAPDSALAVRLPCSFCYRRFPTAKACLLELRPEVVAARALEILARASFVPS
ncbi:MAG: lipopolysaccharide heptosyltransferase I [Thermoanaerobaculia bacterium]|nr:lipopolysaccharide heptosyltransferase I [Thermoanaerobaculia bacterium]